MAVEIRPEPSAEERAALVQVLASLERTRTVPPGHAWRRAALENGRAYAVALRPRRSAGAARV